MSAPPDFGPNHLTITVNGTTVSNHAPVEGLIGGSVVNSTVHLSDYGPNAFTVTVIGTTPSLHAPVGLFSRLVAPHPRHLPASAAVATNITLGQASFVWTGRGALVSPHIVLGQAHFAWNGQAFSYAHAQVTQVGLEAWVQGGANAQATQTGLEVWTTSTTPAEVQATQTGLEVWTVTTTPAKLQATQVGLEVWTWGVKTLITLGQAGGGAWNGQPANITYPPPAPPARRRRRHIFVY